MLPLTTKTDEGLSAYLVPLLAASPGFDEFCLDEGDEDVDEEDDEGEEEVLSLLQFESKHRLPVCGVLPLSRPGAWLLSR